MKNIYKEIYEDSSEFKIWVKLDNGCYIGTMNYSEKNITILQKLLMSFAEQYGEEIDYEAAKEELKLYSDLGKLFIYLDENLIPVSMNGCIYDYDNETVQFISNKKENLHSLYFYGLSTLKYYRGRGACGHLIRFAIQYAKNIGFDYVYARTDLIGSKSEKIMEKSGLEICKYDNMIITEWVDVTESKGDYRLHLYLPLDESVTTIPKGDFFLASDTEDRKILYEKKKGKELILCKK